MKWICQCGPPRQPRFDRRRFVGGVVVHDDVDIEPVRDIGIDLLEEVEELGCPVALVTLADHEAGGHVERGEQRCRAVADIVMGPPLGIPGIIGSTGCSRSSA